VVESSGKTFNLSADVNVSNHRSDLSNAQEVVTKWKNEKTAEEKGLWCEGTTQPFERTARRRKSPKI